MSDPRRWPPGKTLLALLGVLILVAAVLHGLESLAGRPTRAVKTSETGPPAAPEPLRPTLERVDDWTIELREDLWQRTTFRFDEDDGLEQVEATYACLEQAVAREFDENPTTRRSELQARVRQILRRCSPIAIPALPRASPPDGTAPSTPAEETVGRLSSDQNPGAKRPGG